MKKNVSGQKIGAQLVSAADGSAFTGSVTVAVTGDAGTQATGSVGSGACTHEGNGYHTYAPAQAETNYDLIAFTFTGSGAVPATVQVYTRPTTGLLAPTVADRTLDVSAGGEAGIDWANVGSPTTTVGLSGTTVKTSTDVETRATDIQSRLPAALISGRMDASVAAMASGVLTASAIAADAITDAKVASDVTIASVTGSVGSVTSGVTLAANQDVRNVSGTLPEVTLAATQGSYAPAKAGDAMALTSGERATLAGVIWAALTSGLTTAGSIGKWIIDNLNATVSSRSSHSAADVWSVGTRTITGGTVSTVSDKTGYSLTQSFPTNFSALGINASGHISRVVLCDTTTTNTDMRGTDSAATASALASLVTTVGIAGAGLTALGSATELAKVLKTGEQRTISRAGQTSITFTETRV